jgi:hypothetical protein
VRPAVGVLGAEPGSKLLGFLARHRRQHTNLARTPQTGGRRRVSRRG